MDSEDKWRGALSGVKVIDWTVFQTGPSATQLLADMGAQIIKVERPDGGDLARGGSRDSSKSTTLSHGLPYGFEILNRNKKSITLDLRREEGRQVVYDLVAKADAFVQNFRFGVAKKLGVDRRTAKRYVDSARRKDS